MKRRYLFLVLLALAIMRAPANAQEKQPAITAHAGDIILFKTPDKARQDFYQKLSGAPITHTAIVAYDENGDLKLYHMIGDKNNSTRSGGSTVKTGLIEEDLIPYLTAEKDTLYVRQKSPQLTPQQNAWLTAFLQSQLGTAYYDDKKTLLAAATPKWGPLPPPPTNGYFCSQLVGCVVSGLVGPMELTSKNPFTGTVGPVKDIFGNVSKVYLYPEGILPADLYMTGDKATINISSQWKDPVQLKFPAIKPCGNDK